MTPILGGGLSESNRGHVYKCFRSFSMPTCGYGLGDANLDLTQWFPSVAVVSLDNFTFKSAYSDGVVGIICFAQTCLFI